MHDSSKAIADGILNHLLLLFGGDPIFDLLALTTEHPHMMQLRPNSPIKYSLADEDFMKFRLFYSFLFTLSFFFVYYQLSSNHAVYCAHLSLRKAKE